MNLSLKTIRSRQRYVLTADSENFEGSKGAANFDSNDDMDQRLWKAIAELNEGAAQILILRYIRDENTSPHFGDAVERPEISPGAFIFTAVESLGLKLEPTKGPRGYMVIDGIERPNEN